MITLKRIGNYPITEQLSASAIKARDSRGRHVVLKPLPGDCLLKGQLHPNVKDRLNRVRELALTSVANLYGVERLGEAQENPFLVWEYVAGVAFDEAATDRRRTQRELAKLMRELVLAVDSLHAMGL